MNTSAPYRVQSGDTLSGIARSHGLSPEALMRANGMDPSLADGRLGSSARDPDRLQVGQQLRIPVATPGLEREHRVVAGETLAGIAEHWDVSLQALLAANPQFDAAKLGGKQHAGAGQDPDRLRVGDLIQRPAGRDLAPAPRAATANAAPPLAAGQAPASGGAARLDLAAFVDAARGSDAPAAIVIGHAEGTRRADGGFTRAFGGHTDPGNALHNRGSFSYQGQAATPAEADRLQLTRLQSQLPAFENAAREAGLDAQHPLLAAAYLDTYNQSPRAAARFLEQLDSLRGQPLDVARISDLRVNSYVNVRTGERFVLGDGHVGGGFATIARERLQRTPSEAEVQAVIRADQLRRTEALQSALDAQGLTGAATTSATTSATTAAATPAAEGSTPRWLTAARGELGVSEIRGRQHEARVLDYHASTSLRARNDETAWCSSFVNWSMAEGGVRGTGSARARDWLSWGQTVPREAAQVRPGDVIVFPRGKDPRSGHVAIISAVHADGRVTVVGGNQSQGRNQPEGVTLAERRLSEALGVRRPGAAELLPATAR